ncbi:MAG TPA: hypothetical protein VGI39_00385 [Polyangiaceae bacterium]|jgi:hypothetical protein
MASAKSTRLSIVEQSLSDILERLADLHPTEASVIKLRELRTKAFAYERTTKAWVANPPSEAQRQAMLKLVLELNVAVMELTKAQREESGTPTTGYTPPKPRPVVPTRSSPARATQPRAPSRAPKR